MTLTNKLSKKPIYLALYGIIFSFLTYSSMYAFRKPFAVATFEGVELAGMSIKVWFIIAQMVGYTLSKFIGIKVISEMKHSNRTSSILIMIGIAGLALIGFGFAPIPYKVVFLFLNGLPLGMVWGVVFSYLEGRKNTELMGAGLAVSFIFSSGFVKSIGMYIMLNWGVSEYWMPFVTAALFIPLLVISASMLNKLPPPSKEDISQRTQRTSMTRKERMAFFKQFSMGLILLIAVYILLTAFRDLRDNFAAEIWAQLGYSDSPELFTLTEVPISLGVLVLVGLVMLIKNNMKAFMVNHLMILVGALTVGISTLLFTNQLISPVLWMVLSGFGLYLGYVPFNAILFERLIATFKYASNIGFAMYLADSFGYLGSIGVMLFKDFAEKDVSWLNFFISGSFVLGAVGVLLTFGSGIYFYLKYKKEKETYNAVSSATEAMLASLHKTINLTQSP